MNQAEIALIKNGKKIGPMDFTKFRNHEQRAVPSNKYVPQISVCPGCRQVVRETHTDVEYRTSADDSVLWHIHCLKKNGIK